MKLSTLLAAATTAVLLAGNTFAQERVHDNQLQLTAQAHRLTEEE